MEMPETELNATKRPVWNAGRTVGAKRALKPKQIWEIRFYLNQRRRLRDRALFDLAIDSKLRGCDLVQMKIGDLVSGGQIRTRAIVMQQKTGRPVQFELLPDARASLLAWLERRGGTVDDYVFPSRVDHNGHLSTRQYARLVDEWVTGVGLMRSEYGTHSLRRTKASIIYRATGNLRAVQILLGHSKIENTVRYLGIDVEDALDRAGERLIGDRFLCRLGRGRFRRSGPCRHGQRQSKSEGGERCDPLPHDQNLYMRAARKFRPISGRAMKVFAPASAFCTSPARGLPSVRPSELVRLST